MDDALFATERMPRPLLPWVRYGFVALAAVALAPLFALGVEAWAALAGGLGFALLAPLLWLLGLRRRAARSNACAQAIAVHPTHLRWRDAKGERVVPFREVRSFWRDQRVETAGFAERFSQLVLESGEVLEFTDRLAHYDALCVQLARGLAPVFFPKVFEELDLGHPARIGGVSVSSQGLQWTTGLLLWERLLGYELERDTVAPFNGCVRLRFANPQGGAGEIVVDSSFVPDLGLFLAVVERYGPRRVRVDLVQARAEEAQEAQRAQPPPATAGGATTP